MPTDEMPTNRERTNAAIAAMTGAQVARTVDRLLLISAAFDDIRDAIAQAVEDELAACGEGGQPS